MGEIVKVNSNEVPYEVQDEGGECWTQHKTLEEAIKAFHEIAKQKRDQNGYTAEDEGDGAYLMLALYRGVAGKTCVDDYELHPTAEWSRITQALNKLEMYENGQADYELVRDQRDELAAELERVTTIKNQVVKNCNEWRGIAQDRTEELEIAAGHISDAWLYFDAWARSDSVTIEDVKEICKTILKKQLAPGWVPVERDGE